ncbi:unnamed protein product [[Actinomadura] parvosata subsp. kistnae]|nr:unnamed protein product [Actinomadura parvosata subsp. kistnae]
MAAIAASRAVPASSRRPGDNGKVMGAPRGVRGRDDLARRRVRRADSATG